MTAVLASVKIKSTLLTQHSGTDSKVLLFSPNVIINSKASTRLQSASVGEKLACNIRMPRKECLRKSACSKTVEETPSPAPSLPALSNSALCGRVLSGADIKLSEIPGDEKSDGERK